MVGRAVVVGSKMKVEQDTHGQWNLVEGKANAGEHKAIWEVYLHDFDDAEIFTRRLIGMLNRAVEINGWIGWLKDMCAVVKYGIGWRS